MESPSASPSASSSAEPLFARQKAWIQQQLNSLKQKATEKKQKGPHIVPVVFDLETNGRSFLTTHIITQMAAETFGGEIDKRRFARFVMPNTPWRHFPGSRDVLIQKDRLLEENAKSFQIVCEEFCEFLQEVVRLHAADVEDWTDPEEVMIVFVAHNGRVADLPVLLRHMHAEGLPMPRNWILFDTLLLARDIMGPRKKQGPKMASCTLGSLFRAFTGKSFTAHDAREDTASLCTVAKVCLALHALGKSSEDLLHELLCHFCEGTAVADDDMLGMVEKLADFLLITDDWLDTQDDGSRVAVYDKYVSNNQKIQDWWLKIETGELLSPEKKPQGHRQNSAAVVVENKADCDSSVSSLNESQMDYSTDSVSPTK
jgi:DNA polymerase III epsilon subunit-like protein